MVGEWRVHVTEDFNRLGVRVHLARIVGDEVEHVIGFDSHGLPVTETILRGSSARTPGFFLEREVIEALGEAIKPGPSKAEVARLEEALAVERTRVDSVLTTRLSS